MKSKIIKTFKNWIIDNKLFEHKNERNECMKNIKWLSKPLNTHLFKIYIFPSSKYVNHWEDEIELFIKKILSEKWDKKKNSFKGNEYYMWLFYSFFYKESGDRKNIQMKYDTIFKKYTDENVR